MTQPKELDYGKLFEKGHSPVITIVIDGDLAARKEHYAGFETELQAIAERHQGSVTVNYIDHRRYNSSQSSDYTIFDHSQGKEPSNLVRTSFYTPYLTHPYTVIIPPHADWIGILQENTKIYNQIFGRLRVDGKEKFRLSHITGLPGSIKAFDVAIAPEAILKSLVAMQGRPQAIAYQALAAWNRACRAMDEVFGQYEKDWEGSQSVERALRTLVLALKEATAGRISWDKKGKLQEHLETIDTAARNALDLMTPIVSYEDLEKAAELAKEAHGKEFGLIAKSFQNLREQINDNSVTKEDIKFIAELMDDKGGKIPMSRYNFVIFQIGRTIENMKNISEQEGQDGAKQKIMKGLEQAKEAYEALGRVVERAKELVSKDQGMERK